jgi:hypothetical protein
MTKKSYNLKLAVALRFLRVFVAGFLSVAVVMSFENISSWTDLASALGNIALAGTVAGIAALFVAGDKAIRG